jgi:sec-independent protein translocase protein TatA
MGGLSWWHWMIILAVFVLLFGAKKLPDAARGVGRSLRILKSEVNAMHEDDEKTRKAAGETDATAAMATPSGQITGVPAAPIPPHPQAPTITSVTTVNGVPVEEHRT